MHGKSFDGPNTMLLLKMEGHRDLNSNILRSHPPSTPTISLFSIMSSRKQQDINGIWVFSSPSAEAVRDVTKIWNIYKCYILHMCMLCTSPLYDSSWSLSINFCSLSCQQLGDLSSSYWLVVGLLLSRTPFLSRSFIRPCWGAVSPYCTALSTKRQMFVVIVRVTEKINLIVTFCPAHHLCGAMNY